MSDNISRVVIADDEPLAREILRMRLGREPDFQIVGEARDGDEAIAMIIEQFPDIVFLDVHMPGPSGFEVLQSLPRELMPLVVFVTAYDEYALRAFDVHAVDYLLKPFDEERFQRMLSRVRTHASRDEARQRIASLLDERSAPTAPTRGNTPVASNGAHTSNGGSGGTATQSYLQRFVVKDASGYRLLRTTDIDWIESAGNYVRIHSSSGAAFIVRITMVELERSLDPEQFARIHRSSIVNLDRITELRPATSGDFHVLLSSGTSVRMSRHYRDRLLP
jgi:two-component system LytT family response regulator